MTRNEQKDGYEGTISQAWLQPMAALATHRSCGKRMVIVCSTRLIGSYRQKLFGGKMMTTNVISKSRVYIKKAGCIN
jgi:hypothetical protein